MLPNFSFESVKIAAFRNTLLFVFDSVHSLEPHFELL